MHGTTLPPWVQASMEDWVTSNSRQYQYENLPPYQLARTNTSPNVTANPVPPAPATNPSLAAYERYQADLVAQDLAHRKAEADAQAERCARERWSAQLEAHLDLEEKLRRRYIPAPAPAPAPAPGPVLSTPSTTTTSERERQKKDAEDLEKLREEVRERKAREMWESRLGGLKGEIGGLRKIIEGDREKRERREEMDAIRAVARAEAEERLRTGSRRSRSRSQSVSRSRSRSQSRSRSRGRGRGGQRRGGGYRSGTNGFDLNDFGSLLVSTINASKTPRGYYDGSGIGNQQGFLPTTNAYPPSHSLQLGHDRHFESGAALNTTTRHLSSKLDDLDLGQRGLGTKFDRVEGFVGSRFDRVEGRLDDMGDKGAERHRDLTGKLERLHERSEERFLDLNDSLRSFTYAVGRSARS
ncbi:hypothetical protein LZ554_002826 [Drepanopeziza brunnea f. sp. 'monogermtubi']|nr:hypothetical protein LZ554_002826 [Drepanopeziza brunnea f. sp. 'monogermtubi']